MVGQGGIETLTSLSSASFPTQGQRPCDLADEEVMNLLEELAQKQEDVSLNSSFSLLGSSEEVTVTGRADILFPCHSQSWDLLFPSGNLALVEVCERGTSGYMKEMRLHPEFPACLVGRQL